MNKLAMVAFEKLQKREHMLRAARDRKALGRITAQQFREEERAIIEQYELTQDEQRAYEHHREIVTQRKRVK